MGKTIVWCIALATLAVLLVVGCQAPAATSAPAAPAKAPAAATAAPAAPTTAPAAATAAPAAASQPAPTQGPATKTLNVGLMLPMTGPVARMGMNFERFIRMGIDDVNAKGGLKVGNDTYRLNGITVDSKFTSEGGRDAANRLVLAEKVRFVLGCTQPDCAGAQPVTEQAKVLMLATTTTDKSLGPDFPLTMVVGMPHIRMRVTAMYDWLQKEHPNAKRVALALTDDALGRSQGEAATAVAEAHGLTVVAKEYFPLDTKDMNIVATRLLLQKPDVIDHSEGTTVLFSQLMKALYDQGYRGVNFAVSADANQMRSGGASMDGFTTLVLADINAPVVSPADRDLIQRYLAKYSQADLEPLTLNSYILSSVLAQALTKTGTVEDSEKVAATLRAGEWDTTYGKARFVGTKTFGLASAMEQAVYLSKVQNGKLVTFQQLKGTMP